MCQTLASKIDLPLFLRHHQISSVFQIHSQMIPPRSRGKCKKNDKSPLKYLTLEHNMHVLHDGGIKYASLKSLCKVFFLLLILLKTWGDAEKMLDKVNRFLFVF